MITPDDIEFMKAAQNEMYAGRLRRITMTTKVQTGQDRYTKQPIYETTNHVIMAIVTEISGTSGVAIERKLDEGMSVIDGDIQFSVSIDQIELDTDDYKTIVYNGQNYMILAADFKGIGERNRVEFLGRVIK